MRGFTLIELMVTVLIVSILAAISLPAYSSLVQRTLRQDARLALLRVQHWQERYFSENHRYAATLAGNPEALGLSARSDGGHYLLHLEASSAGTGYLAVAQVDPAGRQARDVRCMQFAIDETGRRLIGDRNGRWHDEDSDRCWG